LGTVDFVSLDEYAGPEQRVRLLLRRARQYKVRFRPVVASSTDVAQETSQPASALQVVLEAYTLSSLPHISESLGDDEWRDEDTSESAGAGKGLVALHLASQVMLADLDIDFEAAAAAEQRLVALWPEVVASEDLELQAVANWIRARAMVATATEGIPHVPLLEPLSSARLAGLRASLPFFQAALDRGFADIALAEGADSVRTVYQLLRHDVNRCRVLSDVATVHDLLGDAATRDRISEQWLELDAGDAAREEAWLKEMVEMQGWLAAWGVLSATMTVEDAVQLL
jgi:hypothetical protein